MRNIILIIAFIITQVCFAQESVQELNIVKTELLKEQFLKTTFIEAFIDKKGNKGTIRFFDLMIPENSTNRRRGLIIQKWDNRGVVILNKRYFLDFKNESSISKVFFDKGKFYVLECLANRKKMSLDYFVHSFDEEKGFGRKQLFSVGVEKMPKKTIFRKDGKYDNDYFGNFSFSKDKNYMVYSLDASYKGKEKHKLCLFNGDLELLWKKDFEHESEDALFYLSEVEISNEGELFALAKIYKESVKAKKKGKVNYYYKLFKIKEKEEGSVVLNTSDFLIKELSLKQNEKEVICIGFYSNTNEHEFEGTTFYKVDKSSMNIVKENFQKFSSQLFFDKNIIKADKNISNYNVKQVKRLKNGNYIITAEEFRVDYGAYNSTSYYFNDVIVVCLNDKGDLIWSRNINKEQTGSYFNGNLSISPIIHNDRDIYLFSNAYKQLKELSGNRVELKSATLGLSKKNSNLYSIKINIETGDLKIKPIQKNKDTDMMFDIMSSKEIKESKIILFGAKDKKSQFLDIDLQ